MALGRFCHLVMLRSHSRELRVPPAIQNTTSSDGLCVLVIPQPPSDGQSQLPAVRVELEYLSTNHPSGESTTCRDEGYGLDAFRSPRSPRSREPH